MSNDAGVVSHTVYSARRAASARAIATALGGRPRLRGGPEIDRRKVSEGWTVVDEGGINISSNEAEHMDPPSRRALGRVGFIGRSIPTTDDGDPCRCVGQSGILLQRPTQSIRAYVQSSQRAPMP